MINSLINSYSRSDRDINVLTCVLLVFLFLITVRAALLIYECQFSEIWTLLPYAVHLLSALVVVRVANRLLLNGSIIRENDRRQEVMRTTHHLIAIAKDLKSRVGYVKLMLTEGGRPPIALVQIAKTIEERYEALLHRDAYKHLPGSCIDIITRMSGAIFGIGVLAENVRLASSERPESTFTLKSTIEGSPLPPALALDKLISDTQQLIDILFEIRGSIELKASR